MRINILVIVIFSLITIAGCGISDNKSTQIRSTYKTEFPAKPLVILGDEDDGYGGDIRLSVVNISEDDTDISYKALSTYQNKTLGLIISIPKKKEGDKGFGESITLKSIGKESDYLLGELAGIYKLPAGPNYKFISSISVSYVNLRLFAKSVTTASDNSDPDDDEYKLFFEGKDEAEIFLNINRKAKWVELREKDSEYRSAIISILTAKDK